MIVSQAAYTLFDSGRIETASWSRPPLNSAALVGMQGFACSPPVCIHPDLPPGRHHVKELQKATLLAIRDEMGCRAWSDKELEALVALRGSAISGLQQLFRDLETLREVDLGGTPPADSIGREPKADA
jgi:hypothetical protein